MSVEPRPASRMNREYMIFSIGESCGDAPNSKSQPAFRCRRLPLKFECTGLPFPETVPGLGALIKPGQFRSTRNTFLDKQRLRNRWPPGEHPILLLAN